MTYQEFCSSFLTRLTEKKDLGVKPGEIQFYPEGLSDGDEGYDERFVRETNLRYNQTESDVLIGDYVTVTKTKSEKLSQVSRFSLEELYDRQEEEGWDSVWRYVQGSIKAAGEMLETGVLEQMQNYAADQGQAADSAHLFQRLQTGSSRSMCMSGTVTWLWYSI